MYSDTLGRTCNSSSLIFRAGHIVQQTSTMKLCTMRMSEYSLSRQRKDHQGKQPVQGRKFGTNQIDALPEPFSHVQASPPSSAYLYQHQSILLSQLPIEIRLQIWQHSIGNQTFHIINKYRRLGHAVMDDEYWRQHHAERPNLRASSWIYTFGSLPTTKKLASDNLCDLLVACRQIYNEAKVVFHSTNAFAFWDLRVIVTFKRCISSKDWELVRSTEVYAMFY